MESNTALCEAMETINPADLVLPNNEQALPDEIDLSMMCPPDQVVALPSEPIWINNAAAPVPLQQEQHLPYTGWESLTPNGDLNYSSYGSSPADNTLEYQLMVQRFGHYNLGMARAGLSRATSFSSFDHHPQSPVFSPRRQKRGRILANITCPGPETVYEDSDSHHSWTAADNVETWSSHLRERLSEFRRNKQRVSIITSQLQTRQRRKVHSMANLLGLSHTSLGTGRQKRVLICKCELTKSRAHMNEKRWNPSRNNWTPGMVDPRIVLIDLISPKLSIARLQECLLEAGLPLPIQMTIDCFSPLQLGMLQPTATTYAMFQNADDAALVLLALDGTKPNWNGVDGELECDYVHFPPGFDLSSRTLESFATLPDAIRTERSRMQQGRTQSSLPTNDVNNPYACYSDSESGSDMYHHRRRTTRSRNHSNESFYSQPLSQSRITDPGYVSACTSPLHSDHSGNSQSHKKRKRVPKISGGYSCTFQGCDRVFDRDGDRRKHEKNHAGERPHVCNKCGKGFLFPKDLRRHMIVHSITSLPSENEGGEIEAENDGEIDDEAKENTRRNRGLSVLSSSPPLSEEQFKRLYGAVRPRDRRISRISLSGT